MLKPIRQFSGSKSQQILLENTSPSNYNLHVVNNIPLSSEPNYFAFKLTGKELIAKCKDGRCFCLGHYSGNRWTMPTHGALKHTSCKLFPGVVLQIEDDLEDCRDTLNQIARKVCMMNGIESILYYQHWNDLRKQANLRMNFQTPPCLNEIIDFVAETPIYLNILEAFGKAIEQVSDNDSLESQMFAVFLSCTVIKMLEDAYNHYQYPKANPNPQPDLVFPDEVTLIAYIHTRARTERMKYINIDQKDIRLSLHALCLLWLGCRILDNSITQSRTNVFTRHSNNFFRQLRGIVVDYIKTGEIKEIFPDKTLQEKYLVPLFAAEGEGTLLPKIIQEISKDELFVLMECSLMYDCGNFPLEAILSYLVFCHEIKALPLAALRALNYGSFLIKRHLDKQEIEVWLRNSTVENHQSFSTVLHCCPGYARLRQAAGKVANQFEIQFICNLIYSGYEKIHDFIANGKPVDFFGAYSFEGCGSQFSDFKDCYLSAMRDNPVFLDFLQKYKLSFLQFKDDFCRDYKNCASIEWSIPKSYDPFIEIKDWIMAADAALFIREVSSIYSGLSVSDKKREKEIEEYLHGNRSQLLMTEETERYHDELCIDSHLYRHDSKPLTGMTRSFEEFEISDRLGGNREQWRRN